MADKLRAAAKRVGITSVILSNQWRSHELTPEALVEMELFWAEDFDRVAIVGPLPRYKMLESRLMRWSREDVASIVPDMQFYEAFLKARKRVAGSEMLFIDAITFFCADRPGCSALGTGPLIRDESGHLTLEAMQDYARRLASSGILDTIAP